MGKAQIAEVATHLAQQFLYTYSSVTKQDLHDNIKNDVFPHSYCVVTSRKDLFIYSWTMRRKVLKAIVEKVGAVFVEEDEPGLPDLDKTRGK